MVLEQWGQAGIRILMHLDDTRGRHLHYGFFGACPVFQRQTWDFMVHRVREKWHRGCSDNGVGGDVPLSPIEF